MGDVAQPGRTSTKPGCLNNLPTNHSGAARRLQSCWHQSEAPAAANPSQGGSEVDHAAWLVSGRMAAFLASMIHDVPTDSDVVLELEQQARRQGTGLAAEDLDGLWQLNQTWSREGTASSSFSIGVLRALRGEKQIEEKKQIEKKNK